MSQFLQNFLHDDQGATAIEYSLVAAGLAVAVIAAINIFAGATDSGFSAAGDAVNQLGP